jgi:hypothetical protein
VKLPQPAHKRIAADKSKQPAITSLFFRSYPCKSAFIRGKVFSSPIEFDLTIRSIGFILIEFLTACERMKKMALHQKLFRFGSFA